MAERLTECIDSHLLDNGEMVKEYSLNSKIELNHFSCMDIPNAVYDKLGELEDILEKYGIESFELLEHIIKKGQVINTTIEGFAKEAYNEMEQDRDTWKRACELACEREDDCYVYDNIHRAYEFYQQAKTEGIMREIKFRAKQVDNGEYACIVRYLKNGYSFEFKEREGL